MIQKIFFLTLTISWLTFSKQIFAEGFPEPSTAPQLCAQAYQETMQIRVAQVEKIPTSMIACIQATLALHAQKHLTFDEAKPWIVAHGLLGLGQQLRVATPIDIAQGKTRSGFDWIFSNQQYFGKTAFEKTQRGAKGRGFDGNLMYFEGHPNQFMGYLSEFLLPLDFQVNVENQPVTIRQMLLEVMSTTGVTPPPPLDNDQTYTLWFLARYLPVNLRWRNINNDTWSVTRLAESMLHEPLSMQVTCAGSHRLYAFLVGLIAYQKEKEPLDEYTQYVWKRAQTILIQKQHEARMYQNNDGSYSTQFFYGPGIADARQLSARMAGNAHVNEFMTASLHTEDLRLASTLRGVASLAKDLATYHNHRAAMGWGDTFHGLHALVLFLQRTQLPLPFTYPGIAVKGPLTDERFIFKFGE